MAKRTAVGESGWYEVNRALESAAYSVSADEGVDVREATRMLIDGSVDPSEYGLDGEPKENDETDE